MKKHFNRYWMLLSLVALLISSCEKQLEVAPRQSIDASTALTSREAVEASITALYGRLKNARQYGRDMITHPEALADDGYATNKSGRLLAEANNNFGAHFTGTIWSNSYSAINQINLTLTAIQTLDVNPAVTQAEKDKWEGQLLFLRALYYFDLARVYAYIPGAVVAAQDRGGVVITPDEGFSSSETALDYKPSRAPIADVYNKVASDLEAANSRLLYPGLGVNLANKAATQALLAKVNLYRKNYTDAKRWADSCIAIAGGKMTTVSNYVSNWRADTHGETLFQVRFATNGENIGVNESLQTSFTTLVVPGNPAQLGGFGDLVPTISLMTDLGIDLAGGMTNTNFVTSNAAINSRSTDVRNLLYEPGSTGRGKSYVECTKFIGKNGFINLDNVPLLRIAEVYLIRAEAEASAGSPVLDLAAALADLKVIKSRRYTDYAGSAQEASDDAADQPTLFEEILRQRRVELAFEGNRFFDLKRLGRDINKAPHFNNNVIAFTDIRILPPIPQREVDGNPNLQQNAGY